MKPASFEYFDPSDLDETLDLLDTHGDEAKILAGGQSLMPLLNMRLARFPYLIDITRVAGLNEMGAAEGALSLGATVTQRDVEDSSTVAGQQPLLAEAMRFVGHPQTRNRGTVGGSVAHADPAAELPAVAVALRAEIEVAGKHGCRTVNAENFFLTYFTVAMEPTEMLTRLTLPPWPERTGHAFLEVSRRHGDFALAGVACVLGLGGDDAIERADLVYIGCGETPVRARTAEEALLGGNPGSALWRGAAQAVTEDLRPGSDIHASAEYRREVAGALTERALTLAHQRAQGVARA